MAVLVSKSKFFPIDSESCLSRTKNAQPTNLLRELPYQIDYRQPPCIDSLAFFVAGFLFCPRVSLPVKALFKDLPILLQFNPLWRWNAIRRNHFDYLMTKGEKTRKR